MTTTEELCARLDELGVEYDTYDLPNGEHGVSWIDGNGIEWEVVQRGENFEIHALQLVTPEQAIAATVEPNKTKEWRNVALGLFDALEKADLEVAKRWLCDNDLLGQEIAYGDAKAATVGIGKAKAHPWGYESDTGFFDMTRCECGETNDISAKYCNQCGREIELDMSVIEYAEDWYTPQHVCKVNADGTLTSLRDGKTYVDAATVGRPKVKKVRGMTYDEHGGEVYYLACSGCGEWIGGDLDCITEYDGPNFCHNCGGEFDGPLLCKRCGGLADLEYGDMCAECYEEVGA